MSIEHGSVEDGIKRLHLATGLATFVKGNKGSVVETIVITNYIVSSSRRPQEGQTKGTKPSLYSLVIRALVI